MLGQIRPLLYRVRATILSLILLKQELQSMIVINAALVLLANSDSEG